MRIHTIMTARVIKAQSEMTAGDLLTLFERHGFHHIPVVDAEDHLIGVVSDRDVSKWVSPFVGTDKERDQDRASLSTPAVEIMSEEPVTISENSRIKTASILLLEHNISCLPVIEDENDTMVGIITWKDILNYYVYAEGDAVLP